MKRPLRAVIALALLGCVAVMTCTALAWVLSGPARSATSGRVPSTRPAPTVASLRSASALGGTESLLAGTQVPFADPYDLARRLRHVSGTFPQPTPLVPLSYSLGDRDSFWVLNLGSAQSFEISATLRHISPYLYMWVQDGVHVTPESLEQSARTFEEHLYPTVRRYFGAEWSPGIDNDVRLTVLNASIARAAGYFSSSDQYPRSVVPTSNGREMLYINVDSRQPGSASYDSTLAHELQHMVHWFADPNEDAWVSEGLSELAEHLCGYSKDGRVQVFAVHSDIQLTDWEANSSRVTAHYAASFLFMAYMAERFGSDWTHDLVANEQNGIAGVDAALQAHGLSFEDAFADWVVANYLDRASSNVDVAPYYYYEGLDVQVQAERSFSSYPAHGDGTVNQYGADYIELGPSTQDLQFDFRGEATTRLVPNSAHSGRYQWWSNRGDNSDMTLTRPFDLGGVREASLQVWLWYDIEDGWDYAYVQVSTDGGATWQILPGQYTTTRNPSGQSFGPAYTGLSGDHGSDAAKAAQWIEESFDLSSFAGQEVLIRFEYITDDAVNHAGLCVDDIRIPQLSYRYDVEAGDDGWVAQGFVRTDNTLPQFYLLQVISPGARSSVQRLLVEGKDGTSVTIPQSNADAGPTVVVISGLTRFSYEPAPYRYRVHPK